MDWDIAKWVIDEGIGKGSIDTLLHIPGVSVTLVSMYAHLFLYSLPHQVAEQLGLSFHTAHSLHDKIDALPDDMPWFS